MRNAGERPYRICLFGTSTAPSARVMSNGAPIVWLGAAAQTPEHATHLEAPPTDDPLALVAIAARAFPREHLILVRADVELASHAIDRLLRALECDRVLGAAALDNLVPSRSPLPDAVPADVDVERLDALCFAYGERRLIDAPLSLAIASAWHGERIAELGTATIADSDALAARGLRTVVLDHLYAHAGEAKKNAGETIDPRDPPPPSPLAALRERVAAALAKRATPDKPGLDARPVLLHVLHGWGGGAERWVRDLAAADRDACHLVLISRGSFARRVHGEWLELHDGSLAGPPLRRIPLPRPIADTALADATYRALLAEIIDTYCVDAIVVSSLIGHSLDALATRLPTCAVIHDHYPLWPTLHRDFGDPKLAFDETQRARDLAAGGADAEFANRDPKHWRTIRDATVAALRDARATLIAPSRSALANHLRLAPELGELPQHVIAHGLAPWPDDAPRASAPPPRARARLLVIGRVRRGKGAELLAAALPRLREHADLYLVGAGSDAHALFGERDVHIVLDYKRDALPELVARIAPDAALLLPTVAETFSYTLSELRSLGVPVVATRVGALAERIRDGVDGFLVEPDTDAIVDRVETLFADRSALAQVRHAIATTTDASLDAMAKAYHEIIDVGALSVARYPLAWPNAESLLEATRADTERHLRERERTLRTDLAETRAESERRGDWGHALDRDLAERTRWAQSLDEALRDLKPQYEMVINSSSWRITAPLRRWNARLAGVRARIAFRTTHVRTTIARVRGSLAQRGLRGTLSRIIAEVRGRGPARARITYSAPGDDFARFAVPSSAMPRVSIVMPVYNKIAYTSACLRSISEHAALVPFEVIVVDDCSSDRTAERLADVDGIRAIRNAENLGFVGSCNAGAAAASGELVLFLNNDTVVTAGWLEALVRCLDEAPDAGLVGAK
ncbi:MAG: glycosyltransferase, partial [Rhodanobacteraceae bacterium]